MGDSSSERDGERAWPVSPSLPKDLFRGAANYYAEFRVPYPQELLDDLLARSGAAAGGLLVDLACGTGELALPLSKHFARVVAIDQEPEMIEVARARASHAAIKNVEWNVQSAEDADFPSGSVEMATVGAAFHRLNRKLIARRVRQWLRPGGSLVVLGSNSLWTGKEQWQAIAIETLETFLEPSPTPEKSPEAAPKMTHREVLAEAGYQVCEKEFLVPHVWGLDSFWGYLLSTSKRSAILAAGSRLETELRRRLLAFDPSGRYRETMVFFYLLARTSE